MNSGVIHGCNGDSVTVCDSFMKLLVLVYSDFDRALVALHNEWCLLSNMRVFESSVYLFNFVSLLRMSTGDSWIPVPCF